MEDGIIAIIEQCNGQLSAIDKYANAICRELKEHCESADWDQDQLFKNLPGIYIVLVRLNGKTKIDALLASLKTNLPAQNTPNPVKRSKQDLKDQMDYVAFPNTYVLYLGKSEQLSKRISEHLKAPTNNGTYALRLGNRNLIKDVELSVFTKVIPNIPVLNNSPTTNPKAGLQFVITNLEASLRKRLKPLVGKQ